MKIGIKYCGGCNPRYDRSKEVENLKKDFPTFNFVLVSKQNNCDVILVVCGCFSACAQTSDLYAEKGIWIIRSATDFIEIREKFQKQL